MHAADDVHGLPIERIKLDAVARECDRANARSTAACPPWGTATPRPIAVEPSCSCFRKPNLRANLEILQSSWIAHST